MIMTNQQSNESILVIILKNANEETSDFFFSQQDFVLFPYKKDQENSSGSGNIAVHLKGRCQA